MSGDKLCDEIAIHSFPDQFKHHKTNHLLPYHKIRIVEGCVGESIAKIVLRFVNHIAIGPVYHAVTDHRWQLLNTSVPSDHQPPCWIELACQNTEHCITRL